MIRDHLPNAGRSWSYFGLTVGLGLSLAANVAAAYIGHHEPDLVDLGIAGFPPGAVFVAIEVLARNTWPAESRWTKIKRAVVVGVAVPAAIISYVHLAHLVLDHQGVRWGQVGPPDFVPIVVALLTPLMIDGLVSACTAALLIPDHDVSRETVTPVDLPGVNPRVGAIVIVREIKVPVPQKASARPLEPRQRPPKALAASTPQQTQSARYRTEQHPLWPEFIADWTSGQAWDDTRMLKELRILEPNATAEAARARNKRWKAYSESLNL